MVQLHLKPTVSMAVVMEKRPAYLPALIVHMLAPLVHQTKLTEDTDVIVDKVEDLVQES